MRNELLNQYVKIEQEKAKLSSEEASLQSKAYLYISENQNKKWKFKGYMPIEIFGFAPDMSVIYSRDEGCGKDYDYCAPLKFVLNYSFED